MKLNRRQFLSGVAAGAMLLALSGGIALGFTVQDTWMETPDVLAFTVDDDALVLGPINPVYQDESATAWSTWVQRENRAKPGNPVEWCQVIGLTKSYLSFSDLPSPNYVNRVALRDYSKYSIIGGAGLTVTAAYYRNEAVGQGRYDTSMALNALTSWRMTVYLQLASPPVPGQEYTISHADGAVSNFTFTFDDKTTRAGGIKVTFGGHRRNDAFKKAYLCSRLPGGPVHGTVDFAAYGISQYHIIDASGWVWYTGSITLRRAWNEPEVAQGYDTGIDVADIADSRPITAITKGNPTAIECVAHGLSNGDKVRLFGITGINSFEDALPTGEPGIWKGATVTVVDADNITININSAGFAGTFSTTPDYDVALGGFANLLFRCFTTNRAGTNVWEMDYSAWQASAFGEYRIWIPGYGVSDPFRVDDACWNKLASLQHQGFYNLRLGCDVDTPTYQRSAGLVDGVGGCQNYYSDLIAMFTTESAFKTEPAGLGTAVNSGFGGYVNAGAGALVSITRSGTTATATTPSPHGQPIGTTFFVTITGATTGYNSTSSAGAAAGYNPYPSGTAWLATSTGTNTFDFGPVGGSLTTPAPAPGRYRSGFVTNIRATGSRGATQDAGDNDDIACDHMGGQYSLANVFMALDKPGRYTTFQVQLSSQLLDPILFAGTDNLPPLFHELFWYAEQYRTQQHASGDVPGGVGVGKFGSQVPSGREPIQYYRGVDAGGALVGQTVMAFWYAADHFTTACWCALAAKLAQIAYDYNLIALGDAYRDSAVAAWDRVIELMSDITACDAYYLTQLDLATRMGWTMAQYRSGISSMNSFAQQQMWNASGSLYRLFGSVAGQTPYGDFIDNRFVFAISSVAAGGSGYAVGDLVTLDIFGALNNPILRITGISAGAVTSASIHYAGNFPSSSNPVSQLNTTGSGAGATFNLTTLPLYQSNMDQTFGAVDYYKTPGRKDVVANYIVSRINAGNTGTFPPIYLGSTSCFNNMITPNSTSGGTNFSPTPMLIAHIMYTAVNGVEASRDSQYLRSMQAGMSWIVGANQVGKSFTRGLGPRYFQCLQHNDTLKMGIVNPMGITPWGYFGWAFSLMFDNFAVSNIAADGPLTNCANNITADFESLVQKGSTKQWNPPRWGSSYWEWQPENRLIIFNSEFVLASLPMYTAAALYMSAWDGNTATEYSDRRFGWGPR